MEWILARIERILDGDATEEQRVLIKAIADSGQRVTNMKRTLARSKTALHALLEWYPLHDVVSPFLGERLTAIFCHAISARNDCLICSTYFRRELMDAGEDPDSLALDDREGTVVEFGRQIAVDANDVNDELYGRLAAYFTAEQIVDLTAFAGLMVATNIFNDALRIPLDEELYSYQARNSAAASIG
jgi:alkylhydroperoxidase family enzyme